MPLLKAIRQLCGDFGLVAPGETFNCSDEDAESLESRGLVERIQVPIGKAFVPPENKMMPSPDNKQRR